MGFPYGAPMASQPSTTQAASNESNRDAGLRLDGARFRRELRVRGVTAGTVARVARVSPNTLTRCLSGAPISERTLREIVRALTSMPVLQGASELLAPETATAAAPSIVAAAASHGRSSTSAPCTTA
jgi:hypothetical protein